MINATDEDISRAYTELMHSLRAEVSVYKKAMEFHWEMVDRKFPNSDKNIDKWDRALLIIRKYQTKYYNNVVEYF